MNPTSYSDEELKKMIETDLLNDDRVSSQTINLAVRDGIATLKGTIRSFRRKLAAHRIVASYDGIRDVHNQMTVEPEPAGSDTEIAENVRAVLDTSADITKETVTVSVNGGKATLSGNVASHWERLVAEDIVRSVRGVRDVINLLVTNPTYKMENHLLMEKVQDVLRRSRGLASADIAVAIGEDTVVLSGFVKESWQKESAHDAVGRFGFLHIRNDIQVTG